MQFVPYVVFEVPSNLILKKMRPSRYIPITMILWAVVQVFMGLVKNYSQLLALRFLLGFFEAGLFPGLNFYLTGWYRREELMRRVAGFFGGAVMSGAFGGVFAYAIGLMDGTAGMAGWSWIFIIEGLLTFVIAFLSFWMIFDWPRDARFLTPLEKEFVIYRLKNDTGLPEGTDEGFSKRATLRGIMDWKTPLFMLAYLGAGECVYSQSLFTPTIVASLGKWSAAQSLLLSVPPYVLGFITTMTTAYISDKTKKRGIFNVFWSVVAFVGYLVLIVTKPSNVAGQYAAVYVTTMAICPMIAVTITWAGNSFANHFKKGTAMGLVFSAGNAGGIISSFAYRPADAPPKGHYVPGHAVALSLISLAGVVSIVLLWGLNRENKRRQAQFGSVSENEVHDYDDEEYKRRWGLEGKTRQEIVDLGDDHPAFRYIL